MDEILRYFPRNMQKAIFEEIEDKFDSLEEIRVRVGKTILLKFHVTEKIVKYTVSQQEIIGCLQLICENSIYSYQNQISEGFVTIKGGHRVGITGSCVIENGKPININYICSLNFRIARQVIGSSDKVLKYVLNLEENIIYNTLVVSSPGAGKTTILRDIIRQLASRNKRIRF